MEVGLGSEGVAELHRTDLGQGQVVVIGPLLVLALQLRFFVCHDTIEVYNDTIAMWNTLGDIDLNTCQDKFSKCQNKLRKNTH